MRGIYYVLCPVPRRHICRVLNSIKCQAQAFLLTVCELDLFYFIFYVCTLFCWGLPSKFVL